MSREIPGGEVVMHPGPKERGGGMRAQHGAHDVKDGYGGNDVIMSGGPPPLQEGEDRPLGQHNTMVQDYPGNTVQMSRLIEDETGVREEDKLPPLDPAIAEREREYTEIFSKVSFHTRSEMEEIAKNMELEHIDGISNTELAELIAKTIILTEANNQDDEEKDG